MDLQKEALVRQYVLIVDRSGSMSTPDGKGRTRWDSAGVAVENMVDTIFKYDVDHTVPLYVFDSEVIFVGELTSPSQVKQVFREYRPRGTKRPNYEVVPGTTFIVLLDGGADDEEAIALSFVQIGDDPNAERFLTRLDETAEPDICDTKKDDILYQAGGLDRLLHDAIFD
ncbi:hypothetical protein JKP88DRAFT_273716 [Tribonema minus]|uniref:VWFA domain-containing protein n=1 Tax=Tribonema minus TaxID=303371 RepID=A0A835YQU7_9STRA|nr:hypothetical protein JKP88DRAFT_273716 [Tribonema minus]